jgi:hypothetical protein
MTFKDLKKRIGSSSNQQQTQSFDKLQNKPFWIWNIEEHKLEDIRTKGECCFNHIMITVDWILKSAEGKSLLY